MFSDLALLLAEGYKWSKSKTRYAIEREQKYVIVEKSLDIYIHIPCALDAV